MNRDKFQHQRKNIYIKGGMDVRRQVMGSDIGAYFQENYIPGHTLSVGADVWKICFFDLKTGEIHRFHFLNRFYIGRVAYQEMNVPQLVLAMDPRVSKQHCMIFERDGNLCIQDLGSKNHTYVNGKIIQTARYLYTGDILKVGSSSFRVEYGR